MSLWVVGIPLHARFRERPWRRAVGVVRGVVRLATWGFVILLALGPNVLVQVVAGLLPMVVTLTAVMGPEAGFAVFVGSVVALVTGFIRPSVVGMRSRGKSLAVYGGLALIGVLWVGAMRQPPLGVDQSAIVSPTDAEEVTLTGYVARGYLLRVNGRDRTSEADRRGRFEIRHPLHMGTNEIALSVHRALDGEAELTVTLVVERIPPAVPLSVTSPQSRNVRQDNVVIEGVTLPDARVQASTGRAVTADAAGRFRLGMTLREEGAHEVVIRASKSGYRESSVTLNLRRILSEQERRERFAAEAVIVPFRGLARNT